MMCATDEVKGGGKPEKKPTGPGPVLRTEMMLREWKQKVVAVVAETGGPVGQPLGINCFPCRWA